MIRLIVTFISLLFLTSQISGQMVKVNGYVYESGNRGYLNQVDINIVSKSTGQSLEHVSSNKEGYFEVELPSNEEFVAYAKKQLFVNQEIKFDTKNVEDGKKFLKIQMEREPGYDFEVTLAPKRESEDIPVDAIRGAWIEVYNNTTEKEVLNLKDHADLEFNVHFDKGNHYTLMIRKEGFFTKRMEAYVNIEGCILCFEGVGSIRPGVVDNLTEGNKMGVLLTNVELDPLFSGKTFEVQNIYYDLGKSSLRPESKVALNNLATVLKDNPHISVELGSHTDSRGSDESNQILSDARAKSAVDYLTNTCNVNPRSIVAAGYGESLILNDCRNGVKCSEEEHQENRRTAIRVLNINDEKRERKTLKEIRVEEEFMKSIMNDEIETKVVKGDEKPDSKESNSKNSKQNEPETKAKKTSSQKQTTQTSIQRDVDPNSSNRVVMENNAPPPKTVAKPRVDFESEEKARLKKEQMKQQKKLQKEKELAEREAAMKLEREKAAEAQRLMEEKELQEKETARLLEEEKAQAEKQAAILREKELAENKRLVAEELEMEKEAAKLAAEREAKEKEEIERKAKEMALAKKEQEAKELEALKKAELEKANEAVAMNQRPVTNEEKIPDTRFNTLGSYTGYTVVIQFSRYPLPDDHEIFERHENITVYKATTGSILYMIGDFKTEEKAKSFLEGTVLLMYPGAYIINFENGRRLR